MSLAIVEPVGLYEPGGSPAWWLRRLIDRLAVQAQRADILDEYYRGEQGLPAMCQSVRQSYQRLMALARTNFAELVVEAVRERMEVVGFRTGGSDDPTGDAEAWRLWQDNALDADADLVHRSLLSMAAAYVIVGRDAEGVIITPEDPRQVVAEMDPVRRRRTRAALKIFHDDLAELDRVYLYLPGYVYTASRPAPTQFGDYLPNDIGAFMSAGQWEWDPGTPARLPSMTVPVVPFFNRMDLFQVPTGEFERHLGLLDRINYVTLNRLEIATLQAFRQRGIKGVPERDEFGNPVDYDDVFSADPGALWLLPETAELWESGQVDLTPVLKSAEADVQQLAAVSRTPMRYFFPSEANQSAEGAEAEREALVFKTQERMRQAGESWETVMALAFEYEGDATRASRPDMEVIWADPQRYSLSERADAAAKAAAGGLTWRATMEGIWQLSPQQIDRMESERFADALQMSLTAPPAAPATPAPPGPPGVPQA